MAMDRPFVTVLMSCFNASGFLRESVESILGQTFADFEFIIIDDGSTDNTISVIEMYAAEDKRILGIYKEHTGLTDSLNVGLARARGQWIARIDADDMALPDRLADQLDFVRVHRDISLVGGGCVEIGEGGNFIKRHNYPAASAELIDRLEKMIPIFPHSSIFFNREFVSGLGGYNARFTRAQDTDLYFRIGENGRLACGHKPVLKLRRHSETISNEDEGRPQVIMGLAAIICHFLRKNNLPDPSRMDEWAWQAFIGWIERRLGQEDYLKEMASRLAIRDILYRESGITRMEKVWMIAKKLIRDPSARSIFKGFARRNDLALKLASEAGSWQIMGQGRSDVSR